MFPFSCEMAKSFVRAWQGSSSVGWQCQGAEHPPALEGSSHKTPGNTFSHIGQKRSEMLDAAEDKTVSGKWRARGLGTHPSPRE